MQTCWCPSRPTGFANAPTRRWLYARPYVSAKLLDKAERWTRTERDALRSRRPGSELSEEIPKERRDEGICAFVVILALGVGIGRRAEDDRAVHRATVELAAFPISR